MDNRFMTILAILQLNKGFNLTISRGKFKMKRSKDRKTMLMLTLINTLQNSNI